MAITVVYHRVLWNPDKAVHATRFIQTSQTEKFSALPLNRRANANLRRTGNKLYPVDMLYGRAR